MPLVAIIEGVLVIFGSAYLYSGQRNALIPSIFGLES